MITLDDLRARAKAVQEASMFGKADAAQVLFDSVMQYLTEQDQRLRLLEKELKS